MLAGPQMLSWPKKQIEHIIYQLNAVQSISSVEIKPYSPNQANDFDLSYVQYENFLKHWFDTSKEFIFVNEEKIKGVFRGTSHSFSDDHLYINPAGDFCVLDFDSNDNEQFISLDNLEEYFEWSNKEKIKVSNNSYCSQCEYLGHCLSEHLREVKDIQYSCNGFKNLIDWYRSERL